MQGMSQSDTRPYLESTTYGECVATHSDNWIYFPVGVARKSATENAPRDLRRINDLQWCASAQ
jgi:hypothetical protein